MIIYLISSEINDEILYKIGITRKSAEYRLKQLKTGNPAVLKVVNTFESKWAFKIETSLHERFFNFHINGEWYNLSEEIVSSFVKLCKDLDEIFTYLSINNTWIIDKKILK